MQGQPPGATPDKALPTLLKLQAPCQKQVLHLQVIDKQFGQPAHGHFAPLRQYTL
jgi:hypothetical protein